MVVDCVAASPRLRIQSLFGEEGSRWLQVGRQQTGAVHCAEGQDIFVDTSTLLVRMNIESDPRYF